LTNSIELRTKLKGLVIVAILFTTSSKAQQLEKVITVDTTELSIYWDSSQVRLSKSIADKDYWFNILKEDTSLISFFRIRANNKPYYIYIASIDRISGSAFQYELMIYSRPVTVSPKDLSAFGYATYHVTLIPSLNGIRIISEVKFNGIVI
jgi:hypothetical protein